MYFVHYLVFKLSPGWGCWSLWVQVFPLSEFQPNAEGHLSRCVPPQAAAHPARPAVVDEMRALPLLHLLAHARACPAMQRHAASAAAHLPGVRCTRAGMFRAVWAAARPPMRRVASQPCPPAAFHSAGLAMWVVCADVATAVAVVSLRGPLQVCDGVVKRGRGGTWGLLRKRQWGVW